MKITNLCLQQMKCRLSRNNEVGNHSWNGAHLSPYCEELESQPPVVGPQEVCPDAEKFYQLQRVQEVHRQQVDHGGRVEHPSSGEAHYALSNEVNMAPVVGH